MASLKDVAREAEVSIATASRVLNNDLTLSAATSTKERVIQAAKKLNYLPAAKKRKKNNPGQPKQELGLIMFCSKDQEYEDEYFMSIRRGIETACNQFNMTISAIVRQGEDLIENANLNSFDGLFVVGNISPDLVSELYAKNDRVIFIDESPETEKFDSVTSNFFKATNQLMEHLFSHGHKQIGYIGGHEIIHTPSADPDLQEIDNIEKLRFLPYKNFINRHGSFNEDHIYLGEWSTEAGYNIMKQAIEKKTLPSAFMIASDPLAIGAIRALHEAGLRVPEDLSIVSFNDIEIAKYMNPPLTTAKVYAEEMGKTAVKLLIERFEGRQVPAKVIHPCHIQIRESCTSVKSPSDPMSV
ncbi:LacI family DNA-binding transcriptional regulator [Salipaludibacillus sp. CUR1]|uniref:LacI family DNA-binding transcriptional regulator n=1 Tax=Salipaludibacillus sp. CUR1 TaxID=2820003 RepID=UPI001E613696|nr:LacI family DNA-binding transcriptional regulator [Salipaludibacillus sp. CUR1]MCE7792694.1 LacI family DNA-binding transcriptional regulator [Salipaludibacillus sp. CUR1]